MKWLKCALLIFSVFSPTVFAQDESEDDPFRVFTRWIEMVRGAERDYRNKNGRYADLAALRKAHLLDRLVFESDSSDPSVKADANFVRKRTVFQVAVSNDGQHFSAVIGNWCTSTMVKVDDRRKGKYGMSETISCPPVRLPVLDSPEGPIISVAR